MQGDHLEEHFNHSRDARLGLELGLIQTVWK